jgi:hypothetical protein
MGKRRSFIAELKEEAKRQGKSFDVQEWRGKGSHAMVWVGDKVSIVTNRDIDPETASKIRKQPGLD